MFWSQQDGVADSKVALNDHFWINNLPKDGPLFTYRYAGGLCPLTKKVFLHQLNMIAVLLEEDSHGIHIGGTLEFLLQGMPFDVMKSLG